MILLLRKFSFLLILLGLNTLGFGQKPEILRADPPNWWVGFQHPTVEILIKGNHLTTDVSLNGEGVNLARVEKTSNPGYLILNVEISPAAPAQTLEFIFKNGSKKQKFSYQLMARSSQNKQLMGLGPQDFMYLITPDRFANGNPKNDVVAGMNESVADRNEPYGRHGGDIEGIISKLDYIKSLGVTALWINPLLENNQPEQSYHGYAITDHYLIDARFGSNADYQRLVDEMHKRGLKMVMDMVYNHWGSQHYLHKNLPDSNMVHWFDDFTRTNYRAATLHDPHASVRDRVQFANGWFDYHMPDLNQSNALMASYLTQNSIWWIEMFGIDAFRVDTYAYPDQGYMSELNERILSEYPNFFIFGETWVHGPQVQNFFIGQNKNNKDFDSHLQSVTDFQWYFALEKGIHEKTEWTNGLSRMYYILSGDYMYAHPENLVTFVDNHDIARWYGHCGEDMQKFKIGIALLLTSRGIPQLYYGTEILMKATDGHGPIREDFWGGWPTDTVDKFTNEGRSKLENEAFDFIANLANFRKSSAALTAGALTQFTPVDGVYSYIRHAENGEKVLVVVNGTDEDATVDMSRYDELVAIGSTFTDVLNRFESNVPQTIKLSGRSFVVWSIQ